MGIASNTFVPLEDLELTAEIAAAKLAAKYPPALPMYVRHLADHTSIEFPVPGPVPHRFGLSFAVPSHLSPAMRRAFLRSVFLSRRSELLELIARHYLTLPWQDPPR